MSESVFDISSPLSTFILVLVPEWLTIDFILKLLQHDLFSKSFQQTPFVMSVAIFFRWWFSLLDVLQLFLEVLLLLFVRLIEVRMHTCSDSGRIVSWVVWVPFVALIHNPTVSLDIITSHTTLFYNPLTTFSKVWVSNTQVFLYAVYLWIFSGALVSCSFSCIWLFWLLMSPKISSLIRHYYL